MILPSLRRTLTAKFIVLLLCFLVLQAVQLVVGITAILHLGEETALVNEVGKQRMTAFLLASYTRQAVDAGRWGQVEQEVFDRSVAETDRFFQYYGEAALIAQLPNLSAKTHFAAAKRVWTNELRPSLVLVRQGNLPALATDTALRRYESLAPEQVLRFDSIVTIIEHGIHNDTVSLAVFQSLLLGVTLILGVVGLYMARIIVTLPMRKLIEAANAIAAGAYQQRVPFSSRDEIGELGATFNQMTTAIAEKTERITALNQVAVVVTSSLSKEDALDRIMRHGMQLVGAKAACIGLYDQRTQRFDEWVTQGLSTIFVEALQATPGNLANQCFSSDTYVLSNDRPATTCQLGPRERDEGIKCYICLPLTSHERHLGIINLYLTDREDFLPDEIELLTTFGHLAAGAIENARLYASMSELAARDVLTGLYNRRMLEQRLLEETQRAFRYAKPYSVLMLDIDRFKVINDTHGHPAGDAVLQSLAQIMLQEVRDIDTVARYGGEEFVIILPETEGQAGTLLADRLRTAIAKTPIALPVGGEISITVSIGIASYPRCADTSQLVIERADQALYVAKQSGRNRVSFYGDMLKTQLEKNPARIVDLLNQDRRNISAVATAADVKASYFHNHSEKVDEVAAHLGNILGLTSADLEILHHAAQLHDVGLITVPDSVLQKSAAFGQLEQELMRRHPVVMADILEQTAELKSVAPVVRHHHEHFDGSGYPDGLKGEAIPYLSRILAVADAYNAMVSQRPHRTSLTPSAACGVLQREADKQFDPEMVRAFMLLKERGLLPDK